MSKKKVKFNIMDALILLTVLAVIAVLLYVFVFSETNAGSSTNDTYTLTYVVEVPKLRDEFASLIVPGTAVIDSSKKMPIGTVTSVEILPHQHMATNYSNGTLALTEVDGYCNLYVTIEAVATLSGISYSIGGYDICVGKLVYLSLTNLVCEGYCISLSAVQ